jgi:hypothetical protein
LAIVLILAGSKQIEWARGINFEQEDHHREVMRQRELEEEEQEIEKEKQIAVKAKEQLDIETANGLSAEVIPSPDIELIVEQARRIQEDEDKKLEYLGKIEAQEKEIKNLDSAIAEFESAINELTKDIKSLENQVADSLAKNDSLTKNNSLLLATVEQKTSEITELKRQQKDLHEQMHEALLAAEQAINELEDLKTKTQKSISTTISQENFSIMADNSESLPSGSNVSFGNGFPQNPVKGDLYLRVDYLPTKLFKWNGAKWIEIDKNATDSYTYNEQYIQHLIERIQKGEYDREDLSDNEKLQIDEYLKNQK